MPRSFYLDIGDYRRTVILAGTGRSGTTWVKDLINFDRSYRVLFEPFHSRNVGLLKDWNYRQYLRPDNREERFLHPATKILSGRIKHPWIDQFHDKALSTRRLVKDIRANLILKWIKRNFPEIPIVLLLRHPCAVAQSKMRLGWDTHLDDFLSQEELMADYLHPFKKVMEAARDSFEKHIMMWCVENYVPLRQFSDDEMHVVFYETLCLDPEHTLMDLMAFIDRSFSEEVLEIIGMPSALSRESSAIVSGDNLTDGWRDHVTDEQIARTIDILSLFGLQKIYSKTSMPLVDGKAALKIFDLS